MPRGWRARAPLLVTSLGHDGSLRLSPLFPPAVAGALLSTHLFVEGSVGSLNVQQAGSAWARCRQPCDRCPASSCLCFGPSGRGFLKTPLPAADLILLPLEQCLCFDVVFSWCGARDALTDGDPQLPEYRMQQPSEPQAPHFPPFQICFIISSSFSSHGSTHCTVS